jgi:putative transposase
MAKELYMTNKTKKPALRRRLGGPLPYESIDELLSQLKGKDAESVLDEWGLISQLQKRLAECMMAAELTHYRKAEAAAGHTRPGNCYGWKVSRTISTPSGELLLDVRGFRGFQPRLLGKWQRCLPQFDDAVVYFDVMRLKIRNEGTVTIKWVYVALGIDVLGRKHVLGLWVEQPTGANFWLEVFNDLKGRGVSNMVVTIVDGSRSFPKAIEAVFPQTQIRPLHAS